MTASPRTSVSAYLDRTMTSCACAFVLYESTVP